MVGRVILSPCMKCHQNAIKNGKIPDSIMYEILTSDNGIMDFQCKEGHNNTVIVQDQSFEILLEMAIDNIIDKYYREAIFNFAAAQERCFDFFNELVLFEKGITLDLYHEVWNQIFKNYSERQLGAFYFLYLFRFNKKFTYDEKKIKIRNDIIHKGKIATKENTYEYGKYVLDNIYTIMESITENIPVSIINDFIYQKQKQKISKVSIKKDNTVSFMSGSIISWVSMTDDEIRQEEKLSRYSKLHPDIYAQKVIEANSSGNKKLYVNENNELIIIDSVNTIVSTKKLHYRGRKLLDELIKYIQQTRKHNSAVKLNLVKKASIISYLDK